MLHGKRSFTTIKYKDMETKYNWEYKRNDNDPEADTVTDHVDYVNCGTIHATEDVIVLFSSDSTLKEDINCISSEGAKEMIKKLRPVFFKWNKKAKEVNDKRDDRVKMGLLAQEVEKVIPSIVYTTDKGYKSIDYIQLISLLIAAIK